MLVGCVLLNKTRREQAEPAALELLRRWPSAARLAAADPAELEPILRPLGLHRTRARTLIRLAAEWDAGERDPASLHGCGRYARDSWAIFVEGDLTVKPGDRELAHRLLSLQSARGGGTIVTPDQQEVPDMATATARKGKITMKEACRLVLEKASGPLHYRDVAKRMIAQKLVTVKGKTPEQSVSAKLATCSARGDTFKRVSPGVYDLLKRNG